MSPIPAKQSQLCIGMVVTSAAVWFSVFNHTPFTICRSMSSTLARDSGISVLPVGLYNGRQIWYNFSALGHFRNTRNSPAQLRTSVMDANSMTKHRMFHLQINKDQPVYISLFICFTYVPRKPKILRSELASH